ncbi:hypothetical protein LXL04_008949 [Taraxacum kok-saghyz]
MERVGRTARVSMRYSLSQRSFENEASSSDMTHVKNQDNDVDFDDVFGGPPTRTRYSFGGGRIKSSEESTSSPSGLGDRPVFGESYSSPRRPTSDDFYDDIFRSSSESARSPKWSSPTSGSRVLNPAHPKIESFASSLPTEFSLPPRMTKAVDIPVFGSNPNASTTILSRFSSPTTQGRDVFGNNQEQQSTENETVHKSKPRTARTGSPSNEFHFSIHKWANVGVPLLISLRGSKVTALSMETIQDSAFQTDNLPSTEKEDINPPSTTNLMESIKKETLSMKQQVDEIKGQEAAIDVEKKEHKETTSDVPIQPPLSDVGKKKLEAKKTNKSSTGSPKNRVKGMVKDFFKISNQESPPKPKTNSLSGSLSSRWKTSAKNRSQEQVPAENVEMARNASITKSFDSEIPAEIMNMVPDTSTTIPMDGEVPKEDVKMVPNSSTTKTSLDSKMPQEVPDVSRTTPLGSKAPTDSFMAEERIGRSKTPKFPQNRTIRKLEDIYFQKDPSPPSESVPHVENIDDPSLDNFHVEELPPVEDKPSETQEELEDTKDLDMKIHVWSSGRKGNIRSLLSTLQLVLWADSGWKPVKLVDIIEANAVKKAYNRAMLCLHPDKLQQKGADSNKKYMAEKVFDILQEAWDHFNSLGTLI